MARSVPAKLVPYKDKKGEWRWRVTRKGRILDAAPEGYKRRATMLRTLHSIYEAYSNFLVAEYADLHTDA